MQRWQDILFQKAISNARDTRYYAKLSLQLLKLTKENKRKMLASFYHLLVCQSSPHDWQ